MYMHHHKGGDLGQRANTLHHYMLNASGLCPTCIILSRVSALVCGPQLCQRLHEHLLEHIEVEVCHGFEL